jgi:glucose-1-phosphate thymidylyltransferase
VVLISAFYFFFMKALLLAGGSGTRLHPLTLAVSKQLLPVYDKPMIYYPLSVLMLAGLREVLIISTPQDLPQFRRLFGDGSQLGMKIEYAEQPRPEGLPQAFLIGREFLAGGPACLILGDNLFYGEGFTPRLRRLAKLARGAAIFAYPVRDPERYGVIELDAATGRALTLEEKPRQPRSHYALPGLYFFDGRVCDFAATLKPGARGELEITDLLRLYLERGELTVEKLGRGFAWLDTGTHRSLIEAANYIEAIEERQGLKIACLEEIALENGWIGHEQVERTAAAMGKSNYADYLRFLLQTRV